MYLNCEVKVEIAYKPELMIATVCYFFFLFITNNVCCNTMECYLKSITIYLGTKHPIFFIRNFSYFILTL